MNLEFCSNTIEFYTIILLLVFLQFINWTLEAFKFRILYQPYESITIKSSICSVYIGNFTSFFTPDRMGSFIGRILYLKNSSKLMITAVTALGNLSQLIVTIFFMISGSIIYLLIDHDLVVLSKELMLTIIPVYLLIFNLLIVIYFKPNLTFKYMHKWKLLKSYILRLESLDKLTVKTKVLVLMLAMFRYMIFYLQFYILIMYFNINISGIELLVFVGLLYGIITFVPSPFMGNIGTREALSIYLASSVLGLYAPVISFIIWLINVALSTLIGGCIYSFVTRKEI